MKISKYSNSFPFYLLILINMVVESIQLRKEVLKGRAANEAGCLFLTMERGFPSELSASEPPLLLRRRPYAACPSPEGEPALLRPFSALLTSVSEVLGGLLPLQKPDTQKAAIAHHI